MSQGTESILLAVTLSPTGHSTSLSLLKLAIPCHSPLSSFPSISLSISLSLYSQNTKIRPIHVLGSLRQKIPPYPTTPVFNSPDNIAHLKNLSNIIFLFLIATPLATLRSSLQQSKNLTPRPRIHLHTYPVTYPTRFTFISFQYVLSSSLSHFNILSILTSLFSHVSSTSPQLSRLLLHVLILYIHPLAYFPFWLPPPNVPIRYLNITSRYLPRSFCSLIRSP